MADITPARKLFDLLVSRDFEPETLDSSGKPAANPADAEIFSFDFRAESGKDYGTVVVMLSDDGELQVYCADNVGKTMESEQDKTDWFNFLEQLKEFAVRTNRLNFGIKNLNHLRYSMQGQAAIKEGLFESWAGKKDVSWNAGATESRLMIKHKRSLGEGEARFRYVESLFIETAEGERYKLPFKNLTAGKAMLEHVRNGGRPYDMRGQHIAEMVNELSVLSRFRRANYGRLLEGDTAQLVEQTDAYYENLQRNLKSLSNRRGYNAYFESWTPAEVSEESVVIEGLKHLFVTQSIDQRIEDALPLIARIQQQENAMKEANIFEAWANTLMEGTWQLPDTPEKQAKLVELMSQDLPVGADATNATEQLYDLIGDDVLFDKLEELAERDANADARQVVYDRLQELSDHPSVQKVINQFQVDADATMNPPEATNPADLEPTESVMHGDYAEDQVDEMLGGDASNELIRDIEIKEPNDNMEESSYPEYQDDLASILRTAGVPAQVRSAPDYELEVDEGKEDSTAQIIKKLLDPVAQGLAGGGKSLSIPLVGEEEMDEETDVTTAGEKILGMTTGGALGAAAGGLAAGPVGAAVGGIVGAGLGNKVAQRAGNKNVANNLNAGANDFKQNTEEGEINKAARKVGTGIADVFNAPSDLVASATSKIWHGDSEHPDIDEGIVDTIKGLAGIKPAQPEPGKEGSRAMKTVGQQSMPAMSTADLSKTLDAPNSPTATGFSNSMIEDDKKDKDSSVAPAVAGAALGGAAGYTAAGGDLIGDISKLFKGTNVPRPTPAEIASGTNAMGDIAGSVFEKDETDEGWKGQLAGGTVGTLAGTAAGSALGPIGAAIGGAAGGTAGQMIGDKLGGNEEEASPLKGKYGHSGKLKAVAENPDFLTRLKELSGMSRN